MFFPLPLSLQWPLLHDQLLGLDSAFSNSTDSAPAPSSRQPTYIVSYSGYENMCEGKENRSTGTSE